MTINLLVVDDVERMPYERLKLEERYPGGVYFNLPSEGIKHATSNPVDVAVIDPIVYGLYLIEEAGELMRTLKSNGAKVIFVDSGLGTEALELTHAEYDAVHVKPYNVEELIAQIEGLVKKE